MRTFLTCPSICEVGKGVNFDPVTVRRFSQVKAPVATSSFVTLAFIPMLACNGAVLLSSSEGKRMKKMVRDIGLFVVAPIALLGGLLAWQFAATTPSCSNGITQQVMSPDDRFKAVVFVTSCNTAPGFTSHISILAKDGILPEGPGNLFASEGHPEQLGFIVQWQSIDKDRLQLQVASQQRGTVLHADPVWSVDANVTATYQLGTLPGKYGN